MDFIPVLITEMSMIIAYYAADCRFTFLPGYKGVATEVVTIYDRTGPDGTRLFFGVPVLVAWENFDNDHADEMRAPDSRSIRAVFPAYHRALGVLATMAAVCRGWSLFLEPHWKTLYQQVKKFIPFLHEYLSQRDTLELITLSPAAAASPQVCRLAIKYMCKNGHKYANQILTTRKPLLKQSDGRPRYIPIKLRTVYVVQNKNTAVRRICYGKEISATERVECRIVEKDPVLRATWLLATVDEFDAKVARRALVLADTRAVMKNLRQTREACELVC